MAMLSEQVKRGARFSSKLRDSPSLALVTSGEIRAVSSAVGHLSDKVHEKGI